MGTAAGAAKARSHPNWRHAKKHGMYNTPEYNAWRAARQRCTNPGNPRYVDYGGRGIIMAEEWAVDFTAFFGHIGPRQPGMTLDRIDNDRGYEPGNVRWATPSQQQMNRRNVNG